MRLGKELRKLRKDKGMGLREVARKADISPAFLSKVELGKEKPPSEEKLRALAMVLGCEEDRLFGLAARLPSDIVKIICRHPREFMALIRRLKNLSAEELSQIAKI
jgi:HTH-type transcriptional regulator, competence development regulator